MDHTKKMCYINISDTENCALLGCYAVSSNFLPTFRNNLSVPSSRVKIPNFLTRRVMTQKSAVFIWFAARAWNQA